MTSATGDCYLQVTIGGLLSLAGNFNGHPNQGRIQKFFKGVLKLKKFSQKGGLTKPLPLNTPLTLTLKESGTFIKLNAHSIIKISNLN